MILNISPSFLDEAAEIYSISWRDSHKDVCSSAFLSEHTPSYMKRKIEREIESGWEYYISLSPFPSGIVSVKGNEISSLYVLPSMERKGIGGELHETCDKSPEDHSGTADLPAVSDPLLHFAGSGAEFAPAGLL